MGSRRSLSSSPRAGRSSTSLCRPGRIAGELTKLRAGRVKLPAGRPLPGRNLSAGGFTSRPPQGSTRQGVQVGSSSVGGEVGGGDPVELLGRAGPRATPGISEFFRPDVGRAVGQQPGADADQGGVQGVGHLAGSGRAAAAWACRMASRSRPMARRPGSGCPARSWRASKAVSPSPLRIWARVMPAWRRGGWMARIRAWRSSTAPQPEHCAPTSSTGPHGSPSAPDQAAASAGSVEGSGPSSRAADRASSTAVGGARGAGHRRLLRSGPATA